MLTNNTQYPENDMASHTLPKHIQMPEAKKAGYFPLILLFVLAKQSLSLTNNCLIFVRD